MLGDFLCGLGENSIIQHVSAPEPSVIKTEVAGLGTIGSSRGGVCRSLLSHVKSRWVIREEVFWHQATLDAAFMERLLEELRIIRQRYFWLHLSRSVVTAWPGLDQALCLVHSRLCICVTWVFLLSHSPLIILSNFGILKDVLSPPLCPSYPLPWPHLAPLHQPHGPYWISDDNLTVPALSSHFDLSLSSFPLVSDS